MENNAHIGETKENRLNRFQSNPPIEVIDTLINSIASHFINEIKTVFDNPENYQTSLMFLGTHSIALIISYGLFNASGKNGYKLFLENFIDGDTVDTKFSTIAIKIHEWRNVLAHRWINAAGHELSYDFNISEGWKREGRYLLINPRVYLNHFIKVFGQNGKIYSYHRFLQDASALEGAKQRFISKYIDPAG
jgi:hypothetical protein